MAALQEESRVAANKARAPFDLSKRYGSVDMYHALSTGVLEAGGASVEAKHSTVSVSIVGEDGIGKDQHHSIIACADASGTKTVVSPPATDRVPGENASGKDKREFVKDGGLSIADALAQAKILQK